MKKIFFLLITLFLTNLSYSQSVYEQVNFDNPADQGNFFSGIQSMVQIPNNGVTGGCLQTPDSTNFGNDNSHYCSKYATIDSATCTTELRFFYSDSVSNPSSFDRIATVWLSPHSDPNHYIIGSISHDKKFEILNYFSAYSSQPLTLANSHWYRLDLTTQKITNTTNVIIELEDMGTTGTTGISFPITDGTVINDSVFANDGDIDVSIIGSKAAGCIYIDNFSFSGPRSSSSCSTSGIQDIGQANAVSLIPSGNFQHVISNQTISSYEIFELSGRLIRRGQLNADQLIDVNGIPAGIYFFVFDKTGPAVRVSLQ